MWRARRVPLTQVTLTAGRNRCTLILPSNGNTHLAPSQRTGMKNLFSSHFFRDWLTVLWHSTLWLFVSSLVLHRLRCVPEKSRRGPPCDTMNYVSDSSGFCPPAAPLQDPEDTLLHIFGVKTVTGWLLEGEKKPWRDIRVFWFWDSLKQEHCSQRPSASCSRLE